MFRFNNHTAISFNDPLPEAVDTVVIGGIRKNRTENDKDGVPGLMDIPMMSWLFKTEKVDDKLEELLIFITPKIIILEQQG